MSKSREQLNDFLREISINKKVVLDIGVQDKPTRRLTKGDPESYWTTDISHQWNPDFIFDLNDANFLNKPLEAYRKITLLDDPPCPTQFDVIFCIEVLEHCWNPVQALQNMVFMLKPGGRIYIATPFINPHHDEWDMLRFTDEWYQEVLPRFNLKIVKIRERVATVGRDYLQMFFAKEAMKYSKVQAKKRGDYTYPIGYLVEARKNVK